MDRALFVAMSGAKQILQAQSANANNLANANSTAFRADLEQFRSQPVFGPGHASRVYAMLERPAVDFSAGAIQNTGRELDVAVNGEGWIAVQSADGGEAYTRAGDLRMTAQGQLLTGEGLPVLGNNGPITIPPTQKLEIGVDGTISFIPQGGNATTQAVIDRIKLVKPPQEQLEKGSDGLMHLADGKPVPADATVRLVPGALESSNVNTVQAMTRMIELQRQYEMQLKLMKAVEDDSAASSRLMQIG